MIFKRKMCLPAIGSKINYDWKFDKELEVSIEVKQKPQARILSTN